MKNRSNLRRLQPLETPVLRFVPTAWAKLIYFCHRGATEIGGFAITSAEDPLLVREFVTLRQETSLAHVRFEDGAVADFFDAQVDRGLRPEQFGRIWLHTHPGESPHPSSTDEETFDRVFGLCDWAIMFILAREGDSYARLRFSTGPGAEMRMEVAVDYREPFEASDWEAWEDEYQANVMPTLDLPRASPSKSEASTDFIGDPWIEELQAMPEPERRRALAELGLWPDLGEDLMAG